MAAGSNNIVTDGLRGGWDAGNRRSYPGTGTVLTDLAGGVNGTLTNEDDDALNFNSFKGGYFEFDGTDGRVDCGDNLIVGWSGLPNEARSGLSVCVWALAENSGDSYQKLVTRSHGGCFDFGIGRSSNNYLYSYVNSGYINTPTDSMNDHYGKWTHYAMRWKRGTGEFRLYINGELEATGSRNYDTIDDTGKYNLSFADRPDGDRALNGAMGPVYIYDRALSDDEIKQNYEATKTRFEPRITKSGLVGNWDAGDPECYVGGDTCKDIANGTDATLEGGITFNSANGGYWEFDGTDDYIQCSTDSILQPQSFSVEAWVYDNQTEGYLPIVAWAGAASPTAGWPAVWTSYLNQGPMIYMDQWGGADFRYFDATAASVVGWHHVMFTYTYDDITTGAFYVDGVSQSVSSTYDDTKASTDTCRIGLSRGYYYKGSMGLVRIYDRALSVAEILDNYNKTKGRFGH